MFVVDSVWVFCLQMKIVQIIRIAYTYIIYLCVCSDIDLFILSLHIIRLATAAAADSFSHSEATYYT